MRGHSTHLGDHLNRGPEKLANDRFPKTIGNRPQHRGRVGEYIGANATSTSKYLYSRSTSTTCVHNHSDKLLRSTTKSQNLRISVVIGEDRPCVSIVDEISSSSTSTPYSWPSKPRSLAPNAQKWSPLGCFLHYFPACCPLSRLPRCRWSGGRLQSGNAISFGLQALIASGYYDKTFRGVPNQSFVIGIAIAALSAVVMMHMVSRKLGIWINNISDIVKVGLLVAIICLDRQSSWQVCRLWRCSSE